MVKGPRIMNPNNTTRHSLDRAARDLVCPLCDGESIVTSQHSDTFNYGSGDSAVTLHVDLPVHRCAECEFEFVDHEGERLRHEAVCRHLRILSPAEVRDVRQQHGMTKAAFAQVTGLGEATLSRWENGAVVQNRANDLYLRLLTTPWIMTKLQDLSAPEPAPSGGTVDTSQRFRELEVSKSVRRKQARFQLRLAN